MPESPEQNGTRDQTTNGGDLDGLKRAGRRRSGDSGVEAQKAEAEEHVPDAVGVGMLHHQRAGRSEGLEGGVEAKERDDQEDAEGEVLNRVRGAKAARARENQADRENHGEQERTTEEGKAKGENLGHVCSMANFFGRVNRGKGGESTAEY